jgi:hypothetical protein
MTGPDLTPEDRAALNEFIAENSDPQYTAKMDQALASGGVLLDVAVEDYLRLRTLMPDPIAFRIMSASLSQLDRVSGFALLFTAVHRLVAIHETVTDATTRRDTDHKEN